MKKKVLSMLLAALMLLSTLVIPPITASAETESIVWDFSDDAWQTPLKSKGNPGVDILTTWDITINGLNFYSTQKNRWNTTYIQLGGKGSATERVFTFSADYAGTLSVLVSNTGSSADMNRNVLVQTDDKTDEIQSKPGGYKSSAPEEITFNIDKGVQKVFMDAALRIYKISYTYELTPPSRTLQSIYIDGTATKKEYTVGEEFDTAGLKVMGRYDTGEDTEITNGVTWSFEPETLTAGTTSVDITAKVGDFTSPEFTVNGLIVTAAPTYAITNGSPESDSAKNHGYITIDKTAAEGDTVTVEAYPAEGYQLDTLSYVGVQKKTIWQNTPDAPVVNWDSTYLFANSTNADGSELAIFSDADWNAIKSGTFYLKFAGSDGFWIRVMDGWWATSWHDEGFFANDELITDNHDGTYTLKIDFTGYTEFISSMESKNLLFTGSGYTPLEIYYFTSDMQATTIAKDEISGKYQFTMPDCPVTITAQFEKIVAYNYTQQKGYFSLAEAVSEAVSGDEIELWADENAENVVLPDGVTLYAKSGYTGTVTTNVTGKSVAKQDMFGEYQYKYFVTNALTITYKDQGDKAFSGTHESGYPTTFMAEVPLELKSATKTNYTFGGWFDNADCTSDPITGFYAYTYTDDLTLYAKWICNHTSSRTKVDGQAPTESAAGWKDYYKCDCGAMFEDAEGLVPIEDLAAWKSSTGNGYIAPLVHTITPVNGKDATDTEAGYKAYYECNNCNKYYEDATGLIEISNIDEWEAVGGAGYLAPTLIVVDSLDETVEQGSETYEIKEDGIHVYSDGIIFKGKTNRKFIIESEWQSLNLSDIIVENDLIIDGLSDNVTLNLTNAEIKGNVIAENSNGAMYLCAFIDGENIIGGNVESDGSFTVYGNPDASLSVKSIKTETMLYASGLCLENMKENYELGETKTATPDDVTKPIKLTVKKNAGFPDEEEFVINGGKPFKFGEKLNIQPPFVCDENGVPFNPQPELTVVYYRYDDDNEYSYSIVDGVPTEEGKYKVTFYMPEDDLNYTGSGSYDFTIGHNIQMVEGKAATTEDAGYKAYYECKGCNEYYEDASGLVEITNLDAWKAQGGAGYIAKLEKEPATPQTGDASNMTLWATMFALSSMGLCACLVISKKKKNAQ